eukprot:gnl/MRDRNA2_/MRDRNA2_53354_c0_seq1.p1 gnl/MRDRNA2_/MRDRNA2_53354_c0~~gnl/MRDRNA2_/MRDRNA2_53354_c0_seq1.p1  ORF type:complete len:830 (-),score=175.59 gnl/MRDRNA2_/MRDRNA2_53354_c0_seq1:189-2678(-)
MTAQIWRKVKALFFIAMLAGAEVRTAQQGLRLNNLLRGRSASGADKSSGVQEDTKLGTEQLEAMIAGITGNTDPAMQEEMKVAGKHMEAIMNNPSVKKLSQEIADKMMGVIDNPKLAEQMLGMKENLFAKATEGKTADLNFQDQMKQVTQQMETMMSNLNVDEQVKGVTKQIDEMMADPKLQEESQLMSEQMEKMLSNLKSHANLEHEVHVQNSGDHFVNNLVGKLFDQKLKAPKLQHQDLDRMTLGSAAPLSTRRSVAGFRLPPRSAMPVRAPLSRPSLGGRERRIPLTRTSQTFPASLMSHVMTGKPLAVHAAAEGDSFMDKIKGAMPPRKELKKMLPLASIFFSILFVYTILRDTKDVLVVTAGGAEVIPFLKTYMNLPAAMGFSVLYAMLVNRMSSQQIFYTIISTFAVFFGFFATTIYPNRAMLHPVEWAAGAAAALPAGFGPLITIIKYWTFGAFYTFAELWGSVVASLLFWGFANDICSVSEAKKWYPLFGLLANVALIFSGQFIRKVSDLRSTLPPGVDAWGYTLNLLSGAVVIGAGVIMTIYTYMQQKVLTDPEVVPAATEKRKKKAKGPSMGLGESFQYLLSSSYIRNLAFLVIAYGTSINIVEVTWKGKLKEAYPDPNDYSSFMGAFSSTTGTLTLAMMLIGRWILDKFGWGVAALVTPTMLGVTGLTFFSLIVFKEAFTPLTLALGLTPLMMAVYMGAAQNILSKSSKYSLFDPCKETAYIPLDSEMRTKGKAAIDVIGNPLGKSGGAFIQQGALLTCGTLAASAPFLGSVLVIMVGLWITASRGLAVEFEEKAAAMAARQKEEEGGSEGKGPAPAL